MEFQGPKEDKVLEAGLTIPLGKQSTLGPHKIVVVEHDDSTTDIDEAKVVLVIRFLKAVLAPIWRMIRNITYERCTF